MVFDNKHYLDTSDILPGVDTVFISFAPAPSLSRERAEMLMADLKSSNPVIVARALGFLIWAGGER